MNNKIHPDLQRLFLDLIQIDAVSGKEQPVADFIRSVTASLGFLHRKTELHPFPGETAGISLYL